MTKIQYTELSAGYAIECSGHTGFAEPGQDIVCAGISALCRTLAEAAEELADEGLTERHAVEEGDGFFRCEVICADDRYAERIVGVVFRSVMLGLTAIADEYPEYVELD